MLYVGVFIISLLLAGLLSPLARKVGHVAGAGRRRPRGNAAPLIGGLAMAASCLPFLPAAGFLPSTTVHAYAGASALLLCAGALDGHVRIPTWLWLCVEAAAAVIVVRLGGIRIATLGSLFGHGPLAVGTLAAPLAGLAIVGVAHAFRRLDAVNGLAGAVAAATLATMLLAGVWSGYTALVPAMLALLASVSGFLVWNARLPGRPRTPPRLGAEGSTWLGFSLACLAIALTQGAPGNLHPIVLGWLFAVPVLDSMALLIRRAGRGRPASGDGRRQLHHRLCELGCSGNEAVVILALLTVLPGVTGLWLDQAGMPDELSALLGLGALVLTVGLIAFHRGSGAGASDPG